LLAPAAAGAAAAAVAMVAAPAAAAAAPALGAALSCPPGEGDAPKGFPACAGHNPIFPAHPVGMSGGKTSSFLTAAAAAEEALLPEGAAAEGGGELDSASASDFLCGPDFRDDSFLCALGRGVWQLEGVEEHGPAPLSDGGQFSLTRLSPSSSTASLPVAAAMASEAHDNDFSKGISAHCALTGQDRHQGGSEGFNYDPGLVSSVDDRGMVLGYSGAFEDWAHSPRVVDACPAEGEWWSVLKG
jgi:hypothetical protein